MYLQLLTGNDNYAIQQVHGMILDLAEHDGELDKVRLTASQLQYEIINEHIQVFSIIHAEIIGFALTFKTFSTFTGTQNLYLEDFYIKPEYRSHGFGGYTLSLLAQYALNEKMKRFEFGCFLNNPSVNIYREKMAVTEQTNWTTFRADGEQLKELAK